MLPPSCLAPFSRYNEDWVSFVFIPGYLLSNFPSTIDSSKEGQLVQHISCRLLAGFRHGLHCCVRKVRPHRFTGLDLIVNSNSASLDRNIRIQPEKSSFSRISTKINGTKIRRSKHNESVDHSPLSGEVCRTLSFSSFPVSRSQVPGATREYSLKPSR